MRLWLLLWRRWLWVSLHVLQVPNWSKAHFETETETKTDEQNSNFKLQTSKLKSSFQSLESRSGMSSKTLQKSLAYIKAKRPAHPLASTDWTGSFISFQQKFLHLVGRPTVGRTVYVWSLCIFALLDIWFDLMICNDSNDQQWFDNDSNSGLVHSFMIHDQWFRSLSFWRTSKRSRPSRSWLKSSANSGILCRHFMPTVPVLAFPNPERDSMCWELMLGLRDASSFMAPNNGRLGCRPAARGTCYSYSRQLAAVSFSMSDRFEFWALSFASSRVPHTAYSCCRRRRQSFIIFHLLGHYEIMMHDMIWYEMIWYDMMWLYDIWYMIYDIWYDMIPYDMIDSSHRLPHLLILFWFSEVWSNFCLAAWLIRPSLMRYEPLCRCRISAASCCPTAILE